MSEPGSDHITPILDNELANVDRKRRHAVKAAANCVFGHSMRTTNCSWGQLEEWIEVKAPLQKSTSRRRAESPPPNRDLGGRTLFVHG